MFCEEYKVFLDSVSCILAFHCSVCWGSSEYMAFHPNWSQHSFELMREAKSSMVILQWRDSHLWSENMRRAMTQAGPSLPRGVFSYLHSPNVWILSLMSDTCKWKMEWRSDHLNVASLQTRLVRKQLSKFLKKLIKGFSLTLLCSNQLQKSLIVHKQLTNEHITTYHQLSVWEHNAPSRSCLLELGIPAKSSRPLVTSSWIEKNILFFVVVVLYTGHRVSLPSTGLSPTPQCKVSP